MSNVCEFTSLDEANEILELLMRPFNTIGATLHQDEVYVPRLLADGHGVAHGSGLRSRFRRGMGMRQEGWAELVNDAEHGGWVISMMMLSHEHTKTMACTASRSARAGINFTPESGAPKRSGE